jgi:hypothetical protein
VRDAVLVVMEAWLGDLAGDHATPEVGALFQHQDLLAGLGEVGGRGESVVAGADGDDVVFL